MSADVPSAPPSEVRAGDTVQWRRTLADYPASEGWALKYVLVSATAAYNATASADGDDYLLTVDAAATAAWAAGRYALTEYVVKDAQRFTLATTQLQVLPDLAAATGGLDTRTHARKVLDAIEAWMESRAPVAGMLEIAGRRIQHYPLADLLALRDRYRAEVARERGNTGVMRVRL